MDQGPQAGPFSWVLTLLNRVLWGGFVDVMEVPTKTGSLRRRSAYIEVLPVKKVMLIFSSEKYRNKRNAVRT